MSLLKIWGSMNSVDVKKVLWAAQEPGMDFERREAGGVTAAIAARRYK